MNGINESEFFMWRTLFSVAHADNIVTDEEIEFMAQILGDVNFSDEQTKMLKDDIVNPKDAHKMFNGVTDQNDRIQFFEFARDLVWVDGDFGSEEQSVMLHLYQKHLKETNVDELIGKTSLELEDEPCRQSDLSECKPHDGSLHAMLTSFRNCFVRDKS